MGHLPSTLTLEEAERDAYGIAKRLTVRERAPSLEKANGITHISSCLDREIVQRERHGAPDVRLPGLPAVPVLRR